jgi:hypothetical protein
MGCLWVCPVSLAHPMGSSQRECCQLHSREHSSQLSLQLLQNKRLHSFWPQRLRGHWEQECPVRRVPFLIMPHPQRHSFCIFSDPGLQSLVNLYCSFDLEFPCSDLPLITSQTRPVVSRVYPGKKRVWSLGTSVARLHGSIDWI